MKKKTDSYPRYYATFDNFLLYRIRSSGARPEFYRCSPPGWTPSACPDEARVKGSDAAEIRRVSQTEAKRIVELELKHIAREERAAAFEKAFPKSL